MTSKRLPNFWKIYDLYADFSINFFYYLFGQRIIIAIGSTMRAFYITIAICTEIDVVHNQSCSYFSIFIRLMC